MHHIPSERNPAMHEQISLANYHVAGGGHFGAEAFGDPYNPDGPECGEFLIPLADQLFLESMWGATYDINVDERGYIYNWQYFLEGNKWRVNPVGWNGGAVTSLGKYCPGDELSASDQATLNDLALRYTKAQGAVFSQSAAYWAKSLPGWPSVELDFDNQMAWYEVVGTGQWFGEDIFDPPGLETVNTSVESTVSSSAYENYYRMGVGFQELYAPFIYLPANISLHEACSSPTASGTCCGE